MRCRIKCPKCGGDGKGTKSELIKMYKQEVARYKQSLEEYKKTMDRIEKLKKKISEEDIRLLMDYYRYR